MNLILLGPPGAGKGTMATGIKEKYAIPHISTGDLFRAAIKDQTELGKKVKSILDAGDLVSDELTLALVEERLHQKDAQNGFVLDGFPRTIPQAEEFDKLFTVDLVINFTIPHEKIVGRLAGRRICRTCGKIYHVKTLPPRKEGICDIDGGELYTRPDDMEEAILNRLQVYDRQTAPLIEYYQPKGIMRDVDAQGSIDEMFEAVFRLLDDPSLK